MSRVEMSRSPYRDPAVNLAYEEFLLDRAAPAELRLHTYVNEPCVVIGRNQNPWTEAAPGLPVYRRVSGGGAVVHGPDCLCWSFVGDRRAFGLEDGLSFVTAAVGRLGPRLEADDRGALWLGGLKLSGSARAYRGGGVLVHGTLLLRADPEAIEAALCGIKSSASRAVASRRSPVGGLADFLPGLDLETLVSAFEAEARARWPGIGAAGDPGMEPLAAPAARHRSWDWTHGETPAFSVETAAEGRRATLRVERGILTSIESRAGVPPPRVLLSRLGRPFAPETP